MILNYIFIAFIVIAVIVALLRTIGYYFRERLAEYGLYFGEEDLYIFETLTQVTFEKAEDSIGIVLYLIGVMTLWLGILRVAEKAGAVQSLSRWIEPFFVRIFPDLPRGHKAYGSMMMNFAANMLGLDNAATPMGIKAMKDLQEENKNQDTASKAQIMFLVLNTSGLTLIPVSVMALRAGAGASAPAEVFLPILLTTYVATVAGLIFVGVKQKINLLSPFMLGTLGVFTAFIFALVLWLYHQPSDFTAKFSSVAGNFILMGIIALFFIMAFRKKVNVYNSFIEGAKEGFEVGVKIVPYLVGILVAVGVFRASGALEVPLKGIEYAAVALGLPTDFVGALPTAFMKPLSGSGARGMMLEAMDHYTPDSFQAFLASVFQGSTETTFYTIAVYYGAVNIKNTKYTATAGLFADFSGIVAAIFIAYVFFTG